MVAVTAKEEVAALQETVRDVAGHCCDEVYVRSDGTCIGGPPSDEKPGDLEEDRELKAGTYIIAYGNGARLQLALGCWHAQTLSFGDFEFLQDGPLDASRYDVFCANCWGRDGEEVADLASPTSRNDGYSSSE